MRWADTLKIVYKNRRKKGNVRNDQKKEMNWLGHYMINGREERKEDPR